MSYSWIKRDAADVSKVAGTFYTYDIHGNVDTLVQDYEGIAVMATDDRDRYKRITYNYDLISGKVNGVNYQPGETDAFYHRYYYDAENRLTSVKTSRDSVIWEEDAAYEYYRHGPLLRTKLGQLNVQGLDYAYTLQGWLKGINDTAVGDGSNDMGQDGLLDRMTVARDVFGLALHYYDTIGHSDYRAIGDGVAPFAKPNNTDFRSLYNGNIAGMSVNLAALGRASAGVNAEPLFYKYRYDQLNRLVSMRAYKGFDNSTNAWTPVLLDDYREEVRYDPNGNILNYIRNGAPEAGLPKLMDSLTYKYWASTNQLKQVEDDESYSGLYDKDIDNQSDPENYQYDAIGNLVRDEQEDISVAWNVYGKIKTITKTGGNTITYTYDAAGNRVSKLYNDELTVYVRDASGNVMGVYNGAPATSWVQAETHLYGSSRLGLIDGPGIAPQTGITLEGGYEPATLYSFERGGKIFELSNHLGNVLATVKDRTLAVDDGNGEVTYYEGDVVTANDYYPFGMSMPRRRYVYDNTYRYGFNGKENDNEVKGEGGQQDYGMRIYDPRLGRFLSVDPMTKSFPWNSPYSYAEGDVIRSIDLDGLEKYVVTYWYNKSNELEKTTIKAIRNRDSKTIVELNFTAANGKPLTTRNVHIRHLYADGTFKDHVPDKDKLSPSEQALFNKAKSRKSNARPSRQELMTYDLGDQKGGAQIESEGYDPLTHEYREAQERVYNSKYALTAVGTTDMVGTRKNGTIDLNGAPEFKDLLKKIKDDGGYENGIVSLTLNREVDQDDTDKEIAAFERGVKYQGQQIKELLEKAGVKNVTVTTKATIGQGFSNNGVKIKVNN